MSLVLLVALINLALGFAAAVFLGRGPWSRHARRLSHIRKLRSSESHASTQPSRVSKTIAELTPDLERTEHQFQSVAQQLSVDQSGPGPQPSAALRTAVQAAIDQFDTVTVDGMQPSEVGSQATAGLGSLVALLQTARHDLEPLPGTASESTSPDLVQLANRLAAACREARGVFNAAMFSQNTEMKSLSG
jgi:hypothetical protein